MNPLQLLQFLARLFLSTLIVICGGCGYQFQGTKNPLEKFGIRKIYVETFTNKSVRPGLEHHFTNAMVREIRKGRVFELVEDREEADAILSGVISSVDDKPSASYAEIDSTTAAINVATSFTANVSCTVSLQDTTKRVIFLDTFSGTRVHQASMIFEGKSQIDQNANATTPLINESEQRLAIRYLSEQLMFDAYQKLTDIF